MATDVHSRRTVLGTALAAVAGALAAGVAKPLGIRAANNETVTTGNQFTATSTTGVATNAGNGLQGVFNGLTYDSVGSGVYGEANGSYNAYGVYGKNTEGYGVGIRGE